MKTQDAIEYLQKRLHLLNEGKKFLWTLNDRAAVSSLCIDSTKTLTGPTAYLDIYKNMDARRPEVGDEYVVTAVSDFVDPVQGKCWPLEIRRKI